MACPRLLKLTCKTWMGLSECSRLLQLYSDNIFRVRISGECPSIDMIILPTQGGMVDKVFLKFVSDSNSILASSVASGLEVLDAFRWVGCILQQASDFCWGALIL